MPDERALSTRWLTTYTILVGIFGACGLLRPWLEPQSINSGVVVIALILSAFLIGLAVGLWRRRLWAWRANFVALVLPAALAGLWLVVTAVLQLVAVLGGSGRAGFNYTDAVRS